MHVLAEQIRTLDETVQAVDLGQDPAEAVFLSFSDSDLGLVAAVHEGMGETGPGGPRVGLRLANLAALRHPYSVDLYLERVIRKARVVVVRCLGGMDYWRYGIDELAVAARTYGIALAIVPGDGAADPRLAEASTVPAEDLDLVWSWFQAGGPENVRSLMGWISTRLGRPAPYTPAVPLPACACFTEACGCGGTCLAAGEGVADRPVALVVFYRSLRLAADTAPIEALTAALGARGLVAVPISVTSLKDPAAAGALAKAVARLRPDVILNATAFNAGAGDGAAPFAAADCPVVQVVTAATFRTAWESGTRGLSAADLAMNVVLPEVDGRIAGPVISFKGEAARSEALQFAPVKHRPEVSGIDRAADLAAAIVRLRRTPVDARRVAVVLSDYPAKGGRTGYAVGLDGPASLAAVAEDLAACGYDLGGGTIGPGLVRELEDGRHVVRVPFPTYRAWFDVLPEAFRESVLRAWGPAETDPAAEDGAIRIALCRAGNIAFAVQPDRGLREDRAAGYHDPALPPRHAYVAFYLHLRHAFGADAMVHLGAHGTLEWLPGKAVALSDACAPAGLTGRMPIVYPFIVNNPGEAAQAKRRIGAVTLGHLTPPLTAAGVHGVTAEIEALLDEFSAAQSLDPKRAGLLADLILEKAEESGLAADCGLSGDLDRAARLARLDAFVCDLKDLRIADGLHVFGRPMTPERATAMADACGLPLADFANRASAAADDERRHLLAALDGRFVPPGPAGAPSSGRLDVLPTGRNLYAVDPRAVPTRTAAGIGRQTAEAVIARYVQDHGDWPKRIVIDLWGSATMRTGGDDLGQAFALLGVRPTWDAASTRVSGFEILSPARLGRPRVDVTLRVSGLFRDVFPAQIALFDAAVRAVADLDEDAETNPLAGRSLEPRIYGPAPASYGVGLVDAVATGTWTDRADLAERYVDAGAYSYGAAGEGLAARPAFERRIAEADAFVHVQDMAGQDVLDSDAFADHEGGFAAAASAAGGQPALYHVDATRRQAGPTVRTVREEIGRVVRGRATNPRWIAGQMRHGHRGAAEIAETVQNLVAFAAAGDLVDARHFDLVFEATLGDDRVQAFLEAENPKAAAACARAFDEAIRRGLWPSRRNSVQGRIAATLGRAA